MFVTSHASNLACACAMICAMRLCTHIDVDSSYISTVYVCAVRVRQACISESPEQLDALSQPVASRYCRLTKSFAAQLDSRLIATAHRKLIIILRMPDEQPYRCYYYACAAHAKWSGFSLPETAFSAVALEVLCQDDAQRKPSSF